MGFVPMYLGNGLPTIKNITTCFFYQAKLAFSEVKQLLYSLKGHLVVAVVIRISQKYLRTFLRIANTE